MDRFKKACQDRWLIDFKDDDWPLLLAFIRTKSLDLETAIKPVRSGGRRSNVGKG